MVIPRICLLDLTSQEAPCQGFLVASVDRLVPSALDALQASNQPTRLLDHHSLAARFLTTIRQCRQLATQLQVRMCITPELRQLPEARPWFLCARIPSALGASTAHTINCYSGPPRRPAPVVAHSATTKSMA